MVNNSCSRLSIGNPTHPPPGLAASLDQLQPGDCPLPAEESHGLEVGGCWNGMIKDP